MPATIKLAHTGTFVTSVWKGKNNYAEKLKRYEVGGGTVPRLWRSLLVLPLTRFSSKEHKYCETEDKAGNYD